MFVALADNRNQGIVRIPESLGNGQDPKGNLYWGAMYGVKTFFRRSEHWLVAEACTKPTSPAALDRAVFRSRAQPAVYVVADAFDGACMQTALLEFLKAAAGEATIELTARYGSETAPFRTGGSADMVCFIGHNGLMDVRLGAFPENPGRANPQCAVILACKSRAYFLVPLAKARCEPLITTTGLMAPEAYTLDAIIRTWAAGQTPEQVRDAAARAYHQYQKCGLAGARRLFAAGR